MPGRLDKLFAPFEGTRDPLPLAVMRVAFFAGLFLHFAPSLLWLDIGYGRGAVRADAWNHWLFSHLWRIPLGVLRAMALVTLAACIAGIAGWRTRSPRSSRSPAAIAFASFNSIHLQTLALIPAWAILILWSICGGNPRSRLLAGLVLFQVLLAVQFSGIEKLLAGWPGSNEMAIVLAYPRGFMVRDWVAALPLLHGPVSVAPVHVEHARRRARHARRCCSSAARACPPSSRGSCSSSASSRCSRCRRCSTSSSPARRCSRWPTPRSLRLASGFGHGHPDDHLLERRRRRARARRHSSS